MKLSAQFLAYMALLVMVVSNIMANLMIKLGAKDGSDLWFGLFSWHTFVAICLFGFGFLIYAWSLQHILLHVAQTIASLQYAGVIVAAALVFHEKISPMKWVGIVLIGAGILITLRE